MVLTATELMRRLPLAAAPSVDPGLNPNQPNARMKQPEEHHRDVVTRNRVRRAVALELADARSDDDRHRECGDAADRVHDAGAGEVRVAVAQTVAAAERRQPAAAPRPVGEERDT